MSPPVSATPVQLEWHCSDRYLPDRERHDGDADGHRTGRPTSPAPQGSSGISAELDPLWKRVLTGQSFGWRLRRARNRLRGRRRRLARAMLRRLQAARAVRRAAQHSTLATRTRTLIGAGRRRTIDDALRVPVVLDVADESAFRPLVQAGCDGPDSLRIHLTAGDLEVATPKPLSYWHLERGEARWLACRLPHVHPPVGFPTRAEAATVGLDRFAPVASRGHRRGNLLSATRRYRAVDCTRQAGDAVATAALIVDLAGVGAPLVASELPVDVARLVGPELAAAIEGCDPDVLADPRIREVHSIRLRRLAHGRHSAYEALARVAASKGHAVASLPSVSILMATNRPEMVAFAVDQMIRQDYPDLEILCGLHGFSLDDADRERMRTAAPHVQLVEVDGDRDLGQVLATLGERASGALVTKWDDDDWYAPEHLRDLVAAMRYSGAGVVGKAAEYVYLSTLDLTVRRFATGAESYSTTIAGGTLMLTRSMLDQIGSWPVGPRRVDRLLIEAVEAIGAPVYRLHGLGYLLRRDASTTNHTWQVEDDYFLAQSVEQRSGLDLEFAGFPS